MVQTRRLVELQKYIQSLLRTKLPQSYWIIAEISEMSVNRNGHCYLELVDKDDETKEINAKVRATIWAYSYRIVEPHFKSVTGQSLKSGIKVLVQANVEFHEVYGLSLNIKNINPEYTLGDLARKRLEIIKKIEANGLMNLNQQHELPLVAQRIAIVSSPSAAGYQDFKKQVANNSDAYTFYTKLFEASMQGDQVEKSILKAIKTVEKHRNKFDILVIIRGGGSQSDLSCFDTYGLAERIAKCKLPVLTGIGHEKDQTIIDMVAHTSLKTPTAVASFIIDGAKEFEQSIERMERSLVLLSNQRISEEKQRINQLSQLVSPLVIDRIHKEDKILNKAEQNVLHGMQNFLKNHRTKINRLVNQMILSSERMINKNQGFLLEAKPKVLLAVTKQLNKEDNNMIHKTEQLHELTKDILKQESYNLNLFEAKIKLLDPKMILKRGYSITTNNGKVVKDATKLKENDVIETYLSKGKVRSIVK